MYSMSEEYRLIPAENEGVVFSIRNRVQAESLRLPLFATVFAS